MTQLVDYAEFLSTEVGARPGGTEEEQRAALYISDKLKTDAGLPVSIEEFASSANALSARAVCSVVAFICAVMAVVVPAALAVWTIVSIVAAVGAALEAFDRPVITKLLSRGESQNVIAKYKPQSPTAAKNPRKVVLVAHYDSGKAVPGFVRALDNANIPLSLICLGAAIAVPVFTLIKILAPNAAVGLNVLLIIAGLLSVLPFVKALIVRFAPYSEGANCNASGTATLMEIARCVGTGSITADELAPVDEGYVVHDETAAVESGVVPEGAEIVYEVEETVPEPEPAPNKSETERLQTAKAAIAAFTGQPGATWTSEDIEENLQGTEYSQNKKRTLVVKKTVVEAPSDSPESQETMGSAPEEAPTQEQGTDSASSEADPGSMPLDGAEGASVSNADADEDRQSVSPEDTNASAVASVPNGQPTGEGSAHTAAAKAAAVPQQQLEERSASADAAIRANGRAAAAAQQQVQNAGATSTANVPSWFVEAQKKAKRPKQDAKPVHRSRFASALEAAETRGGNTFRAEAQKAYEERIAAQKSESALVAAQGRPMPGEAAAAAAETTQRGAEREAVDQGTLQRTATPSEPVAAAAIPTEEQNVDGLQSEAAPSTEGAASTSERNLPFNQFTAPILEKGETTSAKGAPEVAAQVAAAQPSQTPGPAFAEPVAGMTENADTGNLGPEFNDVSAATNEGSKSDRATNMGEPRQPIAAQVKGTTRAAEEDNARASVPHRSRDYLAGDYDKMPQMASYREFEQAFAEKDVAVPSFMDPWKVKQAAEADVAEERRTADRVEVEASVPDPAASLVEHERISIEVTSDEASDYEDDTSHDQEPIVDERPISSDSEAYDRMHAHDGNGKQNETPQSVSAHGGAPSVSVTSMSAGTGKPEQTDSRMDAASVEREGVESTAASDTLQATVPEPHRRRRTISLPHVGATGSLPFASHGKQKAPLADVDEKGGKSAAKGLLSTLPSIETDVRAQKSPSRSGMLRSLKERIPSPGSSGSDGAGEGTVASVSTVGSFGAAGATGAFAPVGDELIEDVAPDEVYVDDADDSGIEDEFTETGAYAGPGYVSMPQSHLGHIFDRFRRKKSHESDEEQSPQEWLEVDDGFDPREEGRKRGGWESFRNEQESESSQAPKSSSSRPASRDDHEEEPGAPASSQGGQTAVIDPYGDDYRSESYVSGVYSEEVYGEERPGEQGGFGAVPPLVKPGDTSPIVPAVPHSEKDNHPKKRHMQRNQKNTWQGGGFSTERVANEGTEPASADEEAVSDEVERIYQFKEDLFNREVWFVALGSEQDCHDGVRQFIDTHRDELKGAVIVDLESLGAGERALVSREGVFRQTKLSARLKRYVKKAASESGVSVANNVQLRNESAASILSRQGFQALHLVGMEGNGIASKESADDVFENLDERHLQESVNLVISLIRQI